MHFKGDIDFFDGETGELLSQAHNAIHYGNLANIVALALNNAQGSYIHYMAFGNGGTSVDTSGRVLYRTPRVSEGLESSADLYNRTYEKVISFQTVTDNIQVIPGISYSDIKITCTLTKNEPADQDLFDTSVTNEEKYVFNELALFSYPSDPSQGISTSKMMTHAIFHPVQKALNRSIRVVYTIRIQLS